MNEPSVVVLDASVLVAAAGSSMGGSATALTLIHQSAEYRATVSDEILDEAQRNVEWKLSETAAARLYFLLRELNPTTVRAPSDQDLIDLPDTVAAKDRHIVTTCLATGASICLTLDRRHLLSSELQTWAATHGLRFMTPGQFLEEERTRDASSERDT
jgi:predicted nucleic acid-binding protein